LGFEVSTAALSPSRLLELAKRAGQIIQCCSFDAIRVMIAISNNTYLIVILSVKKTRHFIFRPETNHFRSLNCCENSLFREFSFFVFCFLWIYLLVAIAPLDPDNTN